MKFFITILTLSLVLSTAAMAETLDMASQAPQTVEYQYADGDGAYNGKGTNRHEARGQASIQCVNRKVDNYEARNGQLPDDETYDMMIDACLNI